MIGKILLIPFRIVGRSAGLIGSLLKLVFVIGFGLLKFLFKNSVGVILGAIGGFFVAKKVLEEPDCTCDSSKEEPVE